MTATAAEATTDSGAWSGFDAYTPEIRARRDAARSTSDTQSTSCG
ncbi:hypothetical protein [Streptomyces sp. NPDC018000]